MVALKQNLLKIARTSEFQVYYSYYQTYTTNVNLSMWFIAYMIVEDSWRSSKVDQLQPGDSIGFVLNT